MNKTKGTIIFYLGHPAHYHNISIVTKNLDEKGYQIILLARGKDVLFKLLENSPFKVYYVKPKQGKGRVALVKTVLAREFILFRLAIKYKPFLMVGTDIVITHIGRLLGITSFILNEDDSKAVPRFARFGFKYATKVFSPDSCNIDPYEYKKIGYNGYHELAYLHPSYFKPDRTKIEKLFEEKDQFFLIRFASLNAYHDNGVIGINDELARKIIAILSPKGKVWITSERPLSHEFEPYRIAIPPKEIHHAIYFASLYIGDSQTMAAEAAVLGTPSLRFNDFVGKLGYLEELEHKYQLTFGIPTDKPKQLIDMVKEIITDEHSSKDWDRRRKIMLEQTIDVTSFWTIYFENYFKEA